MAFMIPGLYVLGGVCAYAALYHLLAGLQRPREPLHLLFAGMCLTVLPYAIAIIATWQADSIAIYLLGLKLSLSAGIIAITLFPWFIAVYTGYRPMPLLMGLSLCLAVLLTVNSLRPYSLQFDSFSGLRTLEVFWGERFTIGVGERSVWIQLTFITMLVDFGYAIYALIRCFRRERNPASLRMLVAVMVVCLTATVGLLVRIGVVDFVEPGYLGFLFMVILMSMTLSHDLQRRRRISERRFRALVEQSSFGIQVLSMDGNTTQINPAFERLWGEEIQSLVSGNILDCQRLEKMGLRSHIDKALAGEEMQSQPISLKTIPDHGGAVPRRERWMRSYAYPIKDEAGRTENVVLMYEDVTEQQRIQDVIRQIAIGVSASTGDGFFRQLVESLAKLLDADWAFIGVPDGKDADSIRTIVVWGPDGVADNICYRQAGTPCADVLDGETCLHPRGVQGLFPEDTLLVEMGVESYMGSPLLDTGGNLLGIMVALRSEPQDNVDRAREIIEIFAARAGAELERQQAEMQIRRLAYYDYLTGLANRAHLHDHLSALLQRIRGSDEYGALLLIDLDHFKTINDALSHATGDQVLCAVARRLDEISAEDVFAARLGGDEFVLVARTGGADPERAEMVARSLAEEVLEKLQKPLLVGERSFNVGASIGVVVFPQYGGSEFEILQHADMAMYRAKERGRGNLQFYSSHMDQTAARRLQVEEGLRRVLANEELALYFQPQVSADGKVFGAEVLLRWHHPELGEISPEVFIPVAEETGLIHGIGAWVFDQVCSRLAIWGGSDTPAVGHLAVNVSPWQFVNADFVTEIRHALDRHRIDADRLTLELTESALLYDLDETIAKLTALRRLGLSVALDDFGTGYSSFAHLRDLPLDFLKIDKAFVRELDGGVEHPLVGSIIAIGRNMRLQVVAEGVETEAQRDTLVALGCRLFQGYLFCRPLPEGEFLAWVNRWQAAMFSGGGGRASTTR